MTLWRAHHSIEPGKDGLLIQFYVKDNPTGQLRVEDYIAEVDPDTGHILREWDLLEIFKDYIDTQDQENGAQFCAIRRRLASH